jgi:zinc protease
MTEVILLRTPIMKTKAIHMTDQALLERQHTVPDASNVARRVLPNGLVILVRENHSSPSVVVSGYLRCGALHETPAQAGLAGFTASMLRRGTASRTFAEINETLEAVGASAGIGGGRHITDFGGKSLTEDLDLMLEILADILRQPVFPEEHIEKVRGQILTGLQERDNDTRSMASLAFRGTLYGPDHPYGRSLSGEKETILPLQRADLLSYYQQYYGPAGGAIVLVGDVQTERAMARVEELFGNWTHPPTATVGGLPPVPTHAAIERQTLPIPGKTQTDIVLGCVGPTRQSPHYFPAAVGNTILGRFGMMGRLGENVREKQGLAYYAYSALEAGEGPGPWMAVAGVSPVTVERTIDSIVHEIERLCTELVTAEELTDSQAFMTGIVPLRLETNQGVADTLSDIEQYGLGLDYLNRYPDLINQVTAEQIRDAAQQFLLPDAYVVGISGPPDASG